jgi:hypothetical protein
MESRPRARLSSWTSRAAAALGGAVALSILAFYVWRMAVPLPLFAADAGAYLIHALFPDDVAAKNPLVAAVTNGTHLSLIRASWRIGALTGWPYVLIDEVVNGGIYLGGLLGLWQACTKAQAFRERAALLILVVGFAYYRFAFSNMAEGPFVGLLALVLLITRAWYWSRPLVHAAAAGVVCAAMLLAKPNGLALVAALGAVALLDAATRRDWPRLALRLGLFAIAFFATGDAIQLAAQEPLENPLLFFMSPVYSSQLQAVEPAGAIGLAGQALAIMGFASLVLAGPPIVIGLSELVGRLRGERADFRLKRRDLVFLTLLGGLAGTLVMCAVFELKVATTPSETQRLWGRYFEFYAPMLWVAAAPALGRPVSRGLALGCGAATLVGLVGLLGLLQRGWIVLPWDSAVLTAFFAPDPVRAPLTFAVPYRGLAAAASLLAAGVLAARVRPSYAGAALLLALSALSTWQDHVWLGELAGERYALAHDLDAIAPILPAAPRRVVLLTPDANLAHLGFLRLGARPDVVFGQPAQPPAGTLSDAAAVIASGTAGPPGWTQAYRGSQLSLWKPAPAPTPLPSGP